MLGKSNNGERTNPVFPDTDMGTGEVVHLEDPEFYDDNGDYSYDPFGFELDEDSMS